MVRGMFTFETRMRVKRRSGAINWFPREFRFDVIILCKVRFNVIPRSLWEDFQVRWTWLWESYLHFFFSFTGEPLDLLKILLNSQVMRNNCDTDISIYFKKEAATGHLGTYQENAGTRIRRGERVKQEANRGSKGFGIGGSRTYRLIIFLAALLLESRELIGRLVEDRRSVASLQGRKGANGGWFGTLVRDGW